MATARSARSSPGQGPAILNPSGAANPYVGCQGTPATMHLISTDSRAPCCAAAADVAAERLAQGSRKGLFSMRRHGEGERMRTSIRLIQGPIAAAVAVAALLLSSAPLALAHWPDQPPHQFADLGEFDFEGGGKIPNLRMSYVTHGTLNAAKDNAIPVHAWVRAEPSPSRPSDRPGQTARHGQVLHHLHGRTGQYARPSSIQALQPTAGSRRISHPITCGTESKRSTCW